MDFRRFLKEIFHEIEPIIKHTIVTCAIGGLFALGATVLAHCSHESAELCHAFEKWLIVCLVAVFGVFLFIEIINQWWLRSPFARRCERVDCPLKEVSHRHGPEA